MIRHGRHWHLVFLPLLLLLSSSASRADDPEIFCPVGPLDAAYSLLGTGASDSLVVARIVFVTFPDFPDTEKALPTWAEDMRTDLIDYIDAMSRGKQRLDLRIVKRPEA